MTIRANSSTIKTYFHWLIVNTKVKPNKRQCIYIFNYLSPSSSLKAVLRICLDLSLT